MNVIYLILLGFAQLPPSGYWDEIPNQTASLKEHKSFGVAVLLGSEGMPSYDERGKIQPAEFRWNAGFSHHLGLQQDTLLRFVFQRLEREQLAARRVGNAQLQLMIVVKIRKQDHVYPFYVQASAYQIAVTSRTDRRVAARTWGATRFGVCEANSSIRVRHAVDAVITQFVADWKRAHLPHPPPPRLR